MIILSWNCRGLGNLRAVEVLSYLMREKAPKVLFLMETKQTVKEMKWIQNELHFDAMLVVACLGRRGGLAMLWKEEVDLNIQTYNQNHIDALILTKQNMSWRIIGFYGKPEEHLRRETWDLLKHLSTRTSTPWLCIGDYNEILSAEEKNGRLPKPMHLMQEFRSTLLHCGLIDLGYTRNISTWENGREGDDYVQERLDRVCATLAWRELFPYNRVSHFPVSYFDHMPHILNTQVE